MKTSERSDVRVEQEKNSDTMNIYIKDAVEVENGHSSRVGPNTYWISKKETVYKERRIAFVMSGNGGYECYFEMSRYYHADAPDLLSREIVNLGIVFDERQKAVDYLVDWLSVNGGVPSQDVLPEGCRRIMDMYLVR
jgi:hypothetical protein